MSRPIISGAADPPASPQSGRHTSAGARSASPASRRRAARRQRGITLIEALVAALIVAVALMALMNVWLFCFRLTRSSDEQTVAYGLARRILEQARGYSYAFVGAGATVVYADRDGNLQGTQAGAYYGIATTVTESSNAPHPHLNLREAETIVTRVQDGRELCRVQTYLTLGGT